MRPSPLLDLSRVVILGVSFPSALLGQSMTPASLLPTPNTSIQAPSSTARPQSSSITYDGGLLTVSVENGSLSQIVHEIAGKVGMHVSGKVPDLPVFGVYGPSAPANILSTLLDGSGSNFVYAEATDTGPAQLTLTRQTGGITPPDPNAAAAGKADNTDVLSDRQPLPTQSAAPQVQRQEAPGNAGTTGTNATQPSSSVQPVAFPAVGASGTPSTGTTTPSDTAQPTDGTVKTPQQIFEQLQRLRQQQPRPTQ